MPAEGHGNKWTRRQEAAIVALLSEPTVAEAAAKAGIGERTLHSWMREPGFARRYREARHKLVDHYRRVEREQRRLERWWGSAPQLTTETDAEHDGGEAVQVLRRRMIQVRWSPTTHDAFSASRSRAAE